MAEPTILIIGAGTFGTSTAYHLAQKYKDPSRITIIDRSPPPPKEAASIDINRIVRTDYTSPLYCQLANEAIHSWRWDINLQDYFHWQGWLVMDEEGSEFSVGVRQTFKERGSLPIEDVQLSEIGRRWECMKGTETKGFQSAYWNGEAGWCDAASATANFLRAAVDRGVKKVVSKVNSLLLSADKQRLACVRTADGRCLTADKIILAAGAWSSVLLSPLEDTLQIPDSERLEQQLQATARVSAYYKAFSSELDQLSQLPIVLYGQIGEVIPASKESMLLKYNNSKTSMINTITTSSGHRISIPSVPEQSQYDVPEAVKRETEDILLTKLMPELTKGKQPDYWRMCWAADTPTEDWFMCKHPHARLSNLYLAGGGSFHSYK
jgi:sarcosine oxidase / L-pipecolate oxidase